MRTALREVRNRFGEKYPLVIGGERITTESKFESINPANRAQVVGRFQKATKELANRAVETAFETFKSWTPVLAVVGITSMVTTVVLALLVPLR